MSKVRGYHSEYGLITGKMKTFLSYVRLYNNCYYYSSEVMTDEEDEI